MKYQAVKDNLAARAVAAVEVLAALKVEKEPARQRALLRQVAPVLGKDAAPAVEGFLKSPDPWVRLAALAGLIYATEDAKYSKAAADDIQGYMKGTKAGVRVAGAGPDGVKRTPEGWLGEDYFFLDATSRTRGTRWDEAEADKHLRILRGIQKTGILDADVSKRIEEL